MYRVVLAALLVASGCGSRCKEVNAARTALSSRQGAPGRTADVRVTVPFERANTLFDEVLREPIELPLDVPDLGPLELALTKLSATVRQVRLQPGPPGKVRIATTIAIGDTEGEVATLAAVAEVAPRVERGDGGTVLVIGLGPENLLALEPQLSARALEEVVARRIPAKLRDRVPRIVLRAAADKLAAYLAGAGFQALRDKLLVRLGEVARLRLRLPDVPVAHTDIRSTETALVVDILTDLPVRRGLAPGADTGEVDVRISGSAVAELANWAIESGRAPRWYNRSIEPKPDGEFRPRFDYVAEDRAHPFKVYSFQERGGCSYFRVGVRATVRLDGDALVATALDRELEAQSANPVIEAAAWVKYFLVGSLDRSKRIAAHTRLTVGKRTLETRVVGAELVDDEARFALRLSAN
jgi:hypothetical protein